MSPELPCLLAEDHLNKGPLETGQRVRDLLLHSFVLTTCPTVLCTSQAGRVGAGMPGGATVCPFIEARLELAAHNSSVLYLKLVSLAVAVRPPYLRPSQKKAASQTLLQSLQHAMTCHAHEVCHRRQTWSWRRTLWTLWWLCCAACRSATYGRRRLRCYRRSVAAAGLARLTRPHPTNMLSRRGPGEWPGRKTRPVPECVLMYTHASMLYKNATWM